MRVHRTTRRDSSTARPRPAWELVRGTAPTRPHPVVTRRPPGNVLAALPLTGIDRSRDTLETAARRWRRIAPRAESASRALGGVASRVERTRVLRRGEHPTTRAGEPS
jgi:hypothetical protein